MLSINMLASMPKGQQYDNASQQDYGCGLYIYMEEVRPIEFMYDGSN